MHGSDVAARELVARFLEQVLSTAHPVVILHEQPNRGRSLLTKFRQTADAACFGVVLLTGDDEGRGEGGKLLRPRARQNVIFEFGYFMASLKEGHVAVLYEPGVEMPNDISGLVYIEFDAAGSWRMELVREMRAAGVDADLGRL